MSVAEDIVFEELPNLEGMLRDYVVHRIYTEAGPIEVHCVRKEINND